MIKKLFLFAITGLLFFCAKAQSKKIDSLLNVIKTSKEDSVRFSAYFELGVHFQGNNPDTALYFHAKALDEAKKIPGAEGALKKAEAISRIGVDYYFKGNLNRAMSIYQSSLRTVEKFLLDKRKNTQEKAQRLQAKILGYMGVIHNSQGEYLKALDCYSKALKVHEYFFDLRMQAISLNNMGNVYSNKGEYSNALDCYFKALQLHEKLNLKESQAIDLGNIGTVYSAQKNDTKAIAYYTKALKINEETENKKGQAANLHNIGNVCARQKNYKKALAYYEKTLSINEETGDQQNWANTIESMGLMYYEDGEYEKALDCFFKSLHINEQIEEKKAQASNFGNIGDTYMKQKKYKEAEKCLTKAIQIGNELSTIDQLTSSYESLSNLYSCMHRHQEALDMYKKYISCRDSVLSQKNRKASIAKEMQYNYDKAQEAQKVEQTIKDTKNFNEKRRQQLMIYAIAGFSVLLIALALAVSKNLAISKKRNRIISLQKRLVEEKNKEITDSITYAKRIQNAILPNVKKWHALLPNSFVLYQPKDIVAGDFYWLEETDHYIYIAVADCTGHGVPGAMVSVVCSSALSKALLEEKQTDTNTLLDKTRSIVLEQLSKSEENIRDGMDICLIRINKNNKKEIQYSGANRPLYIVNALQELQEIKPNKQPIGQYDEEKPFDKHDMVLNEKDTLYLFSDGYADQFGGPKNKKLSTKKLKETLQEASTMDLTKQKEFLQHFFADYKGIYEQVDDVCVIGLKA
ncbi:MAG: tetratricopeptide repeat protein [Bacteroidetes bacterium]|nr:tetratricopeptide repeat protein [Bacteroidota bacterium]